MFEAVFVSGTTSPVLTQGCFYRAHVRMRSPALMAQVFSVGPNLIPVGSIRALHNGIQSTVLQPEKLTQNAAVEIHEEPIIPWFQHIAIHAPCLLAGIRLAMRSSVTSTINVDIYGSTTDTLMQNYELVISDRLQLQSHQIVDVVIGKNGIVEAVDIRHLTTDVKEHEWFHVVINYDTTSATQQSDNSEPMLQLFRTAVIGEVMEYSNLVQWRMSLTDASKLLQHLRRTLIYVGGVTSTDAVDEASVVCNHIVAVESETIWHDSVSGVVQMKTSKAIPKPLLIHPLYIELWDNFIERALEPTRLFSTLPTGRMARFEVAVQYLLVPTHQRIAQSHTLLSNLPYIVCYIRFANITSTVSMQQQLADVYYDTIIDNSVGSAASHETPPTWTQSAMRFVLPISSDRMSFKGGAMTALQSIGTQSIELDSNIRPPDVCICTHENKVIDLLPMVQTDLPLPIEGHQSEHIDGNFYIGIVLKKLK